VPAPVVIPASIVYFKVVAVKTLVVLLWCAQISPWVARFLLLLIRVGDCAAALAAVPTAFICIRDGVMMCALSQDGQL